MPQIRNTARNEQIFTACLQGKSYKQLAGTHDVSESRINQIFVEEANRQHPAIAASVAIGRGFRQRFLEALKAHGTAA